MLIDKVILTSNEKKDYLDFWPVVSEAWKKLGVEPVLIYTGKKNINLEGSVINFHINNIDSIFTAQCIRLLAPSLFKIQIVLFLTLIVYLCQKTILLIV